MEGLNTTATAVKVEKGIKVIVTPEFKGIVCQCGCTDDKEFNQFISKTVSKDIKGHWTKGEKLYLRCDRCGTLEDWATFKEDSKKLTDPKEKKVIKAKESVHITKDIKMVGSEKEQNVSQWTKPKKSKSEQRREKIMATETPKKKRKVGRPRKK